MAKEKTKKKKQTEKTNRQQIATDWIQDNYLQWNRLRVDTVRQRVQIDGDALWRDLLDRDINDMVCQCCAETGTAITSREVLTVLHSSMLPQVNPLREYVEQQI